MPSARRRSRSLCNEVCRAMLSLRGRAGRLQRRALSHVLSLGSRPIAPPFISGSSAATPLENLCITSSSPSQWSQCPYLGGFYVTSPLSPCLCTVTPIVTAKGPSLCGSLSGVTVVTLVTVVCRCFLDRGRLCISWALTPST